jgi:hypothetical protein
MMPFKGSVRKFRGSSGFTPKTVPVPDVLGGGTQEVLSKVVPVKP